MRVRTLVAAAAVVAVGVVSADASSPVDVWAGEVVSPGLVVGPPGARVVWWARRADGSGAVWALAPGGDPHELTSASENALSLATSATDVVWSTRAGLRVAGGGSAPVDVGRPVPGVVVAAASDGSAGMAIVTHDGRRAYAIVRTQAGAWGRAMPVAAIPGQPVHVDVSPSGTAVVAAASGVMVGSAVGWARPWRYPVEGPSRVGAFRAIADDAGRVSAVWTSGRGGAEHVWTSHRAADGRWTLPHRMSRRFGFPASAVLSHTPGGGVALAFTDGDGVHRVTREAGGEWGVPMRVAAAGCSNGELVADVPLADGEAVTVWSDGNDLRAALSRSDGTVGQPVVIDRRWASTTWAQAAADGDGGVLVAWAHDARTGRQGEATQAISSRRLGRAVLDAASAPGRGTSAVRGLRARRSAGGIRIGLSLALPRAVRVIPGVDTFRGRSLGPRPGRYRTVLRARPSDRAVSVFDPRNPACRVAVAVRGTPAPGTRPR